MIVSSNKLKAKGQGPRHEAEPMWHPPWFVKLIIYSHTVPGIPCSSHLPLQPFWTVVLLGTALFLFCPLMLPGDCLCLHCSGFRFWWKVTHTLLHLRDTAGGVVSLCPVVLVMAVHSIWILSCCLRFSSGRGVLKFPFSCDHGQLVFRSLQQYHLYSVHTWLEKPNWIKDQNSLEGLGLLWCILSPTQAWVLSWIRTTELKGEEICYCLDSGWHGFLFTNP